ncbi:MAG: 2Fe-2S iron-sulfur cluster-binding protein [Pseudomonadota bacterium]
MKFYPLTVTDIRRTIPEAVVVTLQPENPEDFKFIPGQYLTIRHRFDEVEVRRNYSICAGLDDGLLQVGIKRVEGGAFSSFANQTLQVGDKLEAAPPQGRFFTKIEPNTQKSYLAVSGGSGITPILSILRSVLTREPEATFTLVYANRAANTIMFREEIEDLKNRYLERLTVIHVLEAGQDIPLLSGRMDDEKCADLFKHLISVERIDDAFICGPEPMMQVIAKNLEKRGLEPDHIRYELFTEGQVGRLARKAVVKRAAKAPAVDAKVTVDGVTRQFPMPRGQSVLEAALAHDLNAPFSCRNGVCSTCKARLLEGRVDMISNHALEDGEVARGLVLTCQAYPLTDRIVVEYDTH